MNRDKIKIVKVEEGKTLANEGISNLKVIGTVALVAAILIGSNLITANVVNKNNERNNDDARDNNRRIEHQIEETVSNDDISISNDTISSNIIAGSFVDNHNQELYIAGLADAMAIDNAQPNANNSSSNNRNSSSSSSNSGNSGNSNNSNNSSNSQPIDNNVVGTTIPSGTELPNSVIINGGENVNVNQTNNTVINQNSGNGYQSDFNPPQGQENLVIPDPIEIPYEVKEEELVYEGIVVHKLNYEENGIWYAFYESNGTINANVEDVSMLNRSDMDPNNSNIYGISYTGVPNGWTYVCDNDREHQGLGLADDYEVVCDGLVERYKNALQTGSFEVEAGTEFTR